MDVTLKLPIWGTPEITEDLGGSMDYLLFLLNTVRFTQGEDREQLLQEIDKLHRYLERVLGSNYSTLLDYQFDYFGVYGELKEKQWRLSELSDEEPRNVVNGCRHTIGPDGTIISIKQLKAPKAPF